MAAVLAASATATTNPIVKVFLFCDKLSVVSTGLVMERLVITIFNKLAF